MNRLFRNYLRFALCLLLATLLFGLLSSWAYLFQETYNRFLPFYQLRPMHVSAAVFWIITGASAGILHYRKSEGRGLSQHAPGKWFMRGWMITIPVIFVFYAFRKFGGREYWEFPPLLCLPLLGCWLAFLYASAPRPFRLPAKPPLYAVMWTTGIIFFLFTFLEQNLWQIPWFRQSFLRDLTIQWKANGSMVGAWNQMIYGTSLFLMVRMTGDESLAQGKKAFFFYFLGLTNLMFNWGHHIYNLPGHGWIRHVSYAISMTEWLIFLNIIRGFKAKMEERKKLAHLQVYRFILAAEAWIFANLGLALLMSVPAINRYTHGTHITVAHAMGTTIGINIMLLLASLGYMLGIDGQSRRQRRLIAAGFRTTQVSLAAFWISLIGAGVLKGYRSVHLEMASFQEMMQPVTAVLKVFSLTGIGVCAGLGMIVIGYFKAIRRMRMGDRAAASSLQDSQQEQPSRLQIAEAAHMSY